jgi:hypothetical protein
MVLVSEMSKVVRGLNLRIRRMVFALGLGVPVDCETWGFNGFLVDKHTL